MFWFGLFAFMANCVGAHYYIYKENEDTIDEVGAALHQDRIQAL